MTSWIVNHRHLVTLDENVKMNEKKTKIVKSSKYYFFGMCNFKILKMKNISGNQVGLD